MSKALKPSRLDVDPNSPNAAKQWKHWKRTFDNFITECGADAPDKFRSIINFISADVFDYVEECTTYTEVIETLAKLYVKTPNKIFALHELTSRKQKPGESLDEFLEELRKLSKYCNLEAVTAEEYRSELIRDSFIKGLSSNYIRQLLIENAELSLDQAFEKARNILLKRTLKRICNRTIKPHYLVAAIEPGNHESSDPNLESLAAIGKQNATRKHCYFCGGNLHANRASCPARDAICHNCSKKGHFMKVCQSTKKNSNLSTIYKPSLCAILAACPSSLSHASLPVAINGINLTALIDSCSSDNFISEDTFKRLKVQCQSSNKKVTTALTSMESLIIGHCCLTIMLNGQKYDNVRLDILQYLYSDLILGYDFQKQHKNLTFDLGGSKEDLVVTTHSQPVISTVDTNECSPPQTNAAKVADVDPPSLFKKLSKDTKPIATKSRSFNKDDRAFIKNQISSLLEEGLIQRSHSPRRAQGLIVKDELQRHKKRMCTDYSQTINLFTDLDAYPLPRIDDMINKLSQYKVFSTYDLKSAYHQIPLKESKRKYTTFEGLGDLYEFRVLPFGMTNGVPSFQRIINDVITQEDLSDTFPYLDNVTVAGIDQSDHDRNDAAFREMIKGRNLTLNESKTVHSVSVIDILGYRVSHYNIKPKIRPRAETVSFPLANGALTAFNTLKHELGM